MRYRQSFHFPVILIATMIVCAADVAAEVLPVPPQGWRYPTTAEIGQPWRDAHEGRYLVARGDFDGDGEDETVAILFSEERSPRGVPMSIGLFLWPDAGDDPLTLHLQEGVLPIDLQRIGVDILAAGDHVTACGAGFWTCATGEPAALRIRHPAILYFHHESRSGAYFWSAPDSAYRGVAISD